MIGAIHGKEGNKRMRRCSHRTESWGVLISQGRALAFNSPMVLANIASVFQIKRSMFGEVTVTFPMLPRKRQIWDLNLGGIIPKLAFFLPHCYTTCVLKAFSCYPTELLSYLLKVSMKPGNVSMEPGKRSQSHLEYGIKGPLWRALQTAYVPELPHKTHFPDCAEMWKELNRTIQTFFHVQKKDKGKSERKMHRKREWKKRRREGRREERGFISSPKNFKRNTRPCIFIWHMQRILEKEVTGSGNQDVNKAIYPDNSIARALCSVFSTLYPTQSKKISENQAS